MAIGVARGVAVNRIAAFNRLAQMLRQGFPGLVHVGEQRVAAFARQFLGVEHRAQAWQFLVGQIRVPVFAGITQAHRLTVLDDIGDDQDFRVIGEQKLLEHVNLQHAETAAEIDLLLRGDLLITEHNDVVVQMRAVHASEVCVVQRTGQIQADDFRAHLFGEWTHIELLAGACADGEAWEAAGMRTPTPKGIVA
jgi:hypothetical protein